MGITVLTQPELQRVYCKQVNGTDHCSVGSVASCDLVSFERFPVLGNQQSSVDLTSCYAVKRQLCRHMQSASHHLRSGRQANLLLLITSKRQVVQCNGRNDLL